MKKKNEQSEAASAEKKPTSTPAEGIQELWITPSADGQPAEIKLAPGPSANLLLVQMFGCEAVESVSPLWEKKYALPALAMVEMAKKGLERRRRPQAALDGKAVEAVREDTDCINQEQVIYFFAFLHRYGYHRCQGGAFFNKLQDHFNQVLEEIIKDKEANSRKASSQGLSHLSRLQKGIEVNKLFLTRVCDSSLLEEMAKDEKLRDGLGVKKSLLFRGENRSLVKEEDQKYKDAIEKPLGMLRFLFKAEIPNLEKYQKLQGVVEEIAKTLEEMGEEANRINVMKYLKDEAEKIATPGALDVFQRIGWYISQHKPMEVSHVSGDDKSGSAVTTLHFNIWSDVSIQLIISDLPAQDAVKRYRQETYALIMGGKLPSEKLEVFEKVVSVNRFLNFFEQINYTVSFMSKYGAEQKRKSLSLVFAPSAEQQKEWENQAAKIFIEQAVEKNYYGLPGAAMLAAICANQGFFEVGEKIIARAKPLLSAMILSQHFEAAIPQA